MYISEYVKGSVLFLVAFLYDVYSQTLSKLFNLNLQFYIVETILCTCLMQLDCKGCLSFIKVVRRARIVKSAIKADFCL